MTEVLSHWLSPTLTGVALLPLLLAGCSHKPTPLTVVQADATSPASVQLELQACAGLYNRKEGGSVLVESDPHDAVWVDELPLKVSETLTQADFLTRCIAAFPSCVRYSYKDQQALLPNVLTVASVLGAVPLDDGQMPVCSHPAFDAEQVFAANNTPALATQYVFEQYGKKTTGLAMLNPGYDDNPTNPASPGLTTDMLPALVDFVFSQKLFVVYLVNGCIDGNPENAVLNSIVNAGNWPTPLGVYGYNGTWKELGGDLYEAQTLCLDSHNMGAIASETGNLSYYSTVGAPIVKANVVQQNKLESISYDPTRTYVAFVVGDGDNLGYMMTTRHDWFAERVGDCATAGNPCATLTWTISPHLAQLAPDLLQWYYGQSHKTQKDYFTLPPSGHLYAYPSSMGDADQGRFVSATEQDARILGITGTVHWDWFTTWMDAEDDFLPKYATANSSIRGVFPVDVPYSFVAFPSWPPEQFFEVLSGDGGQVVLFRPREWRGITDDTDPTLLSPQAMANEIMGYPQGTVTWVYMTSDGGLTLDNAFYPLVPLLPGNVQLVSTDTAAKLALAASK